MGKLQPPPRGCITVVSNFLSPSSYMLTRLLPCQHGTVGLHVRERRTSGAQLQAPRCPHGWGRTPREQTHQDLPPLQARRLVRRPLHEVALCLAAGQPAERLQSQGGERPDGLDAGLCRGRLLRPGLGQQGTFIHPAAP